MLLFLLITTAQLKAQSAGYELRTNPGEASRNYLRVGSKSFGGFKLEGRYFIEKEEYRITPSKTFKLGDVAKIKLPLHYAPHKNGYKAFTIEPRFIVPFYDGRFDLWVQTEKGWDFNKNTAMSIDYKPKNIKWKFRLGWDTGGYTRIVITKKLW